MPIIAPPLQQRRQFIQFSALGLLSLLVPSCAPPPKMTIVVAESSLSASDALSFIATKNGYWAEEGLDVKILSFTAGKPAFDAMLSGQAQFAFAGETPMAIAAFKHDSYGVLAEIASSPHELALIARKDRGIKSPSDLRGKKVGIMQGTQSDYFLYRTLVNAGIDPATVKTISIQPPEMARAVSSGDVDAISVWQPHSSRALQQLGANGYSLPNDGSYYGIVSLVGSRKFVSENPEVAKRFLRALIKAQAFLSSHPAEAQKIIADQIGLDLSILSTFYPTYDFSVQISDHLLPQLASEGQWAKATGLVPADPALPQYRSYILDAPLRAIDPKRVAALPKN